LSPEPERPLIDCEDDSPRPCEVELLRPEAMRPVSEGERREPLEAERSLPPVRSLPAERSLPDVDRWRLRLGREVDWVLRAMMTDSFLSAG